MTFLKATDDQVKKGATPVLSLADYFRQDQVLMVPPWQREYTWNATDDEGEVFRLLADLKNFYESDSDEYLLGLITLANSDEKINDRPVRYLVDGQQRSVTLMIFLMCAYEYITHSGSIPKEHMSIALPIYEMVAISSDFGTKFQRIRFSQQAANSILEVIHTWMESSISDPEEK